jgi:quinohemoprotein ethanol dehydrogenase
VPGEFAVKLCCGIVNRGVGLHEGNVIWGTLDGRLVSVNGETGALVWEKQVTDPEGWHSITGAPRIADGRIFIGEAGSEYHQRGYMAAYDANNGDELWRWWAVPAAVFCLFSPFRRKTGVPPLRNQVRFRPQKK